MQYLESIKFIDLFKAALLAICSVFITDFLAYKDFSAYIFIGILFLFLTYSLFAKIADTFLVLLFLLFFTPFFPRDLNQEDIQEAANFNTFLSTKLGPFTVAIFAMVLYSGILILRVGFPKKALTNTIFKRLLFVLGLMMFATIIDLAFYRAVTDIRAIVSDLRFFLLLFAGIICGTIISYEPGFNLKKLHGFAVFLTLFFGIKTLMFLGKDIATGDPKMFFSTEPYLFHPLFFSFLFISKIYTKKAILILAILAFISGISISRGNILFFFVCLIVYNLLAASSVKLFLRKILSTTFILLIVVGFFYGVSNFMNEKVANFLNYKLSFFTTELAGSGKTEMNNSTEVRLKEYKNIVDASQSKGYPVAIGQGLGGYFTFRKYPIAFALSSSDYSEDQVNKHIFTRPHTALNYTLLKGGLIFLIVYCSIFVYLFMNGVKKMRATNSPYSKFFLLLCIFISVYGLSLFWLPHFVFLIGVFVSIIQNFHRYEESSNDLRSQSRSQIAAETTMV
jgi:hypothetical protein